MIAGVYLLPKIGNDCKRSKTISKIAATEPAGSFYRLLTFNSGLYGVMQAFPLACFLCCLQCTPCDGILKIRGSSTRCYF